MDFKRKRIFFNTVGAIITLVATLVFVYFVGFYVYCFTHVKMTVYQFSMFPTINGDITTYECGDTVMLNPYGKIERGDVVVANLFNDGTLCIKRLVGMPNDTIRFEAKDDGFDLLINEQLFYHMPKTLTYPNGKGELVVGETQDKYDQFWNMVRGLSYHEEELDRIIQNSQGQWMLKLREDEYFLLGDNWANSKDSATTGDLIPRKEIRGSVDLIIDYNGNGAKEVLNKVLKLMFCK